MTIRPAPISRRRFLTTAAAATSALSLAAGVARPSLSRAADRPRLTHGLQSGDVSIDSGVVWARADRPARLGFDIATSDSFKNVIRSVSLDALPESDFAVKALIDGLPPGQDIFYRVRSADLSDTSVGGEPMTGRFRTAPGRPALGLVRLVGRHRRAGLGHRRGARRHEDLRDDAPAAAGLLHPFGRHDLRRRTDRRREEDAGRRHLEEPGAGGEAEGRRDAGRVPRRTTNTI